METESLIKKGRLLIALSIVCAVVSSMVLLLVPFSNAYSDGLQKVLVYIIAAVFYACLFTEMGLMIYAGKIRRKIIAVRKPRRKMAFRPGIISFISNKYAFFSDLVLLLCTITLIVIVCFHLEQSGLVITTVSFFILSLSFHSIFNGMNYRFYFCSNKKGDKRNEENEI